MMIVMNLMNWGQINRRQGFVQSRYNMDSMVAWYESLSNLNPLDEGLGPDVITEIIGSSVSLSFLTLCPLSSFFTFSQNPTRPQNT